MPTITLICAMDRCRVIGHNGGMPWHLPADLKYFKAHTIGKPIVMGRRTFASMGRPLAQRQNIVLTRTRDFAAPGCLVVTSLAAALKAADGPEVMIIGGGQIYRLTIAMANRLLVTEIDTKIGGGDTTFPAIDKSDWEVVDRRFHGADERNAYDLHFVEYRRLTPTIHLDGSLGAGEIHGR